MKQKILITHQIPEIAENLLKKYFEVNYLNKELNKENLSEYLENKNNLFGLLTLVTDKVNKDIIDILPKNSKIISNMAVGYNNIDIQYCREKQIVVTNTPDILTDATADLTFALLLSLSRRIIEGHNMILKNEFNGWKPNLLLGIELKGKTLGIIGLGRIGSAVAKRAKAFGINIIYNNSKPREINADKKDGVEFKTFNELLKNSDLISLHLPLNNQSKHLITIKELSLMKTSCLLINTSRGEIIKESDLVKALEKKLISGAALDVFEFEPKVTEELKSFSNVVLAPHIGSATVETRNKMAEISAQNIINLYLNESPIFKVN